MLFGHDRGISEPPVKRQKILRQIACMAWFTTSGAMTPYMFKMEDDDGVIRSYEKVRVNGCEKRHYAGTPMYEYDCNIMVNGFSVNVELQFFPEEVKWYLAEK